MDWVARRSRVSVDFPTCSRHSKNAHPARLRGPTEKHDRKLSKGRIPGIRNPRRLRRNSAVENQGQTQPERNGSRPCLPDLKRDVQAMVRWVTAQWLHAVVVATSMQAAASGVAIRTAIGVPRAPAPANALRTARAAMAGVRWGSVGAKRLNGGTQNELASVAETIKTKAPDVVTQITPQYHICH